MQLYKSLRLKKVKGDGRTDQPMDGLTNTVTYRVAYAQLQSELFNWLMAEKSASSVAGQDSKNRRISFLHQHLSTLGSRSRGFCPFFMIVPRVLGARLERIQTFFFNFVFYQNPKFLFFLLWKEEQNRNLLYGNKRTNG